jgi:glutathione peroxidase
MLKIIITLCLTVQLTVAFSQSIYSYTVPKIEGGNKQLSSYQGKKILVLTLPTQQNASNDSLLTSLDSLRAANTTTLAIIAVPAYEDGFTPALKNSLKTWYRSKLNNDIIITDGLFTRKTSGSQQHGLFQWLTDKNKNGHFDNDVSGPRMKFFVWTDGNLDGVLGAPTKLGGFAMNDLLQGQ